MAHPVLRQGNVAVVTGAASGIGLAAAGKFASFGMRVAVADLGADRLAAAAREIEAQAAAGSQVLCVEADVSDRQAVARLQEAVASRWGGTDLLMNNAGVQGGSALFGPIDDWERVLRVNFWGVVHGTRAFVPGMIARGKPGLVINTGSKQGITTPPGDPAYNISKAGVKAFTEALQHDLRNTAGAQDLTAHLLIPGFVWTPLAAGDRKEKPAAAWTAGQTVDFLVERLEQGDFYILCPDNDVSRALDEKRIAWAAGDIVANRPPLSRWHPDYSDAFASFVEG